MRLVPFGRVQVDLDNPLAVGIAKAAAAGEDVYHSDRPRDETAAVAEATLKRERRARKRLAQNPVPIP